MLAASRDLCKSMSCVPSPTPAGTRPTGQLVDTFLAGSRVGYSVMLSGIRAWHLLRVARAKFGASERESGASQQRTRFKHAASPG